MTNVPVLSAEEQANIGADHFLRNGTENCNFCEDGCGYSVSWPCDIARLLATITALERERDGAEEDAKAQINRLDAALNDYYARWRDADARADRAEAVLREIASRQTAGGSMRPPFPMSEDFSRGACYAFRQTAAIAQCALDAAAKEGQGG